MGDATSSSANKASGLPLVWPQEVPDLRPRVCFAAYMSSPCHIELILSEKEQAVKAELVSHAQFFF